MRGGVKDSHARLAFEQAWEARKAEEERASRLKHHIYTQERQAVHLKYRQKHLQQLRTVQTYEVCGGAGEWVSSTKNKMRVQVC